MAAADGSQPDEICWNAGYFHLCGAGRLIFRSVWSSSNVRTQAGLDLFPMEASARFETKGHTYAAGAHGAVVEVDVDAGTVKIIKCVAAHEAGMVINSDYR